MTAAVAAATASRCELASFSVTFSVVLLFLTLTAGFSALVGGVGIGFAGLVGVFAGGGGVCFVGDVMFIMAGGGGIGGGILSTGLMKEDTPVSDDADAD